MADCYTPADLGSSLPTSMGTTDHCTGSGKRSAGALRNRPLKASVLLVLLLSRLPVACGLRRSIRWGRWRSGIHAAGGVASRPPSSCRTERRPNPTSHPAHPSHSSSSGCRTRRNDMSISLGRFEYSTTDAELGHSGERQHAQPMNAMIS